MAYFFVYSVQDISTDVNQMDQLEPISSPQLPSFQDRSLGGTHEMCTAVDGHSSSSQMLQCEGLNIVPQRIFFVYPPTILNHTSQILAEAALFSLSLSSP